MASFLLIASVVIGIYLGRLFYDWLSFRFWLCFVSFAACYSVFNIINFQDTPAAYIGLILLGICEGSLIFILPANVIIGWFHINKTAVMGTVLSLSILGSFPFLKWLSASGNIALGTALLLMFGASIFVVEKPVLINFGNCFKESKHIKKNRLKLSLFFMFSAFAAGVVWRMEQSNLNAAVWGLEKELWMFAGLIIGPAAVALFTNKKGVYSSSVLMIFLSELSVMCAGFYSSDNLMSVLGCLAFGAVVSSTMVVCPLMVYYLMGPSRYNYHIGKVALFMPIGLSLAFPLQNLSDSQVTSYPLMLGTLFVLVLSFFVIFSAWKHRLVLLQ